MHSTADMGVCENFPSGPSESTPTQAVARIDAFAHLAQAVRASHERWDGAGYPDGLAGEEIPLLSRIIAVADTYIALVSERPHRVEYSNLHALSEIVRQSGDAFDPKVVRAFERLKDRLPEFGLTA